MYSVYYIPFDNSVISGRVLILTFVKEVGYAFRTWTTRNHTAKYEVKESRDQSERKCDEYQND
jgi:hypothetical protein